VTDIATRPSLDELFHKWEQFLAAGQFTTASDVAAGHPDLVDPLQRRINDYISARAADLDATLTAEPGASEPSGPSHIPAEYTVVRRLGHGGMGDVWQVRDELNREFALKVARPHRLSEAGQARMMDEMRAMARLDHPHVARIPHYGRHDGVPYFLMPVYPASLKDRLREYQADPIAAVRLMAAVADGVGHLHAAGLVHRDLKPGNVLLDVAGRPAVSDLGLVKTIGDDSSVNGPVKPGSGGSETRPSGAKRSQTVAGAVLGTRSYMSPEQAAGLTHLANPKWDVWALGVILHQLLTGELPPSSEAPERLLDPTEPDNPPPSGVKPGLDPRLERVIQKCLARREVERYTDAREVAEELHALIPPVRPRGRRKWSAVATVALLCGLAAIAIGAVRGWNAETDDERRERLRNELAARLQAKEWVELIDEQGRCPYGFRVVGARPGTTPIEAGEGFVATSVETVLGELIPRDVFVGDFELTGEVQYLLQGAVSSIAGLYYGHNPVGPPDAEDHTFAHFGFREFGEDSPTRRREHNIGPDQQPGEYTLGMTHWVHPDVSRLRLGELKVGPSGVLLTPRPEKAHRPFRRIVLRVTGPTVTVEFQGQPVGAQRHDRMHDQWMALRGDQFPRPAFGPPGGIGVYVHNATVSIRNVRIQSLPGS
jgi:Protein kinase domain